MSFREKNVIITGASSGIGNALAKLLAAEGAKVGVLARRKEKLDALAAEITDAGGEAYVAPADVAERGETVAAVRALRDQLGPIDLLVACAGVAWASNLDHSNVEQIEKLFQINVFGVVYAFEAVLPEMMERRSGHIAAVSSLAAYKGFPGKGAYSGSKAAVNNYLESLRIPLRSKGVYVTTICPGFVDTPMTEKAKFRMPWLMSPEQAARRIHKGLLRRKKVLNFPWQTTLMVKACRWVPDWIFERQMRGGYGDLGTHGENAVSKQLNSPLKST